LLQVSARILMRPVCSGRIHPAWDATGRTNPATTNRLKSLLAARDPGADAAR
jgi:hypothetical protein